MTYEEFKQNFLPNLLTINSFAGRMNYVSQNLQGIGSGSGRIVYDIDGEKVLKLAKNPKGVAQNEAEAGAGYYHDTQHIVTEVFDNADDDTWIIAEKGKKVTDKRIRELTGIPSLEKLYDFLKNVMQNQKPGRNIFSHLLTDEEKEFFWENEFASGLADFAVNYGQEIGDMGRPSSYGEVLRDGQPTIVLTDYGLNDEVYKTHYSPQRKQKYQMYELFNYADGNDDILSDTGDQGDIRRGMWAQMPYSVSDGHGVINEEFIKFVLKHSKYPDKPIAGLPILTDKFHECVNNIKEILNVVENKKQFYGNLLELQNYLIKRGFYDRDPLISEEYEINEEVPAVELFGLKDRNYADELARQVAGKLGLTAPKFLGEGANGFAYTINDNVVMKLTADISEADAASKLMRGHPKYIVNIHNLYKVVDTDKNEAFFVIMQDNIKDKPVEKIRRNIEVMNQIEPQGMNYEDIMVTIKRPSRFNYDEMVEFASHILTDNPEAGFSESERQASYEFFIGILNIRKELLDFGIKSTDYITIDNLGYKNGILTYFDTGGYFGVTEPEIDDKNIISLPENEMIDEEYDKNIADRIANQVAAKLNLNITPMRGGYFGVAYDIGNDKVLKITKDNSEAAENLMLIGKPLKYIAQPYNVYEIKPSVDGSIPKTYAIILEKLDTDPNIDRRYERLNFAFEKILGLSISDVIEHYLGDWDNPKADKSKIDSYFKKNPQDAEFFGGLLRIAEETKSYGIQSMDYLNSSNLGYKKNGALGFFDVGFGNGFLQPKDLEKIEVDEDGSAKFTTSNSINQDNFPVYNNNDTSPSINNNLNANSSMYEDLKYNRVVGDATQDEYKISEERNKSFGAGSKTVEVKKKCKLGGLGNTSVACNQGDINNLEFGSVNESNQNSNDWVNRIVEKLTSYYGKSKNHKLLVKLINAFVKKINTVSFQSFNDFLGSHTDYWNEKNKFFPSLYKLLDIDFDNDFEREYYNIIGLMDSIFDEEETIENINETQTSERYYRAVEKNMGEIIEFEPEGFYEAIDADGNPIWKYDTFWISETPEVAASKTIGGAVMGLYSMFMQYNKNPQVFYIYEISEKPDVDISHWEIGDFTHLKEVRYRRPVQGTYKGKVIITDDLKKRLRAFYEITGLEAYDEPDEEHQEIFQDTDYDQYLSGVKNMVNEKVNLNLPTKLSGYDSFDITNDGQVVGSVGIIDRGIQGNNHYISIDKIIINKDFRGNGYANDAMKILFEYADNNNLIITLTPDNVWGASIPKLKAWYKSLGFVENKGKKKDFQTMQLMYRLPKKLNEYYSSLVPKIDEGETISLQDVPFKKEIEQLGGKIYSVGGAVRDEFLGKQSKDLDILITGIPMDELEQVLSKYGGVNAVGKSFGVLKFVPKGSREEIDIAIPRTEKPSGEGGHKGFDITSDHALPIEKDLERRDFTINAIAKDVSGNIVDPFNGQEDLKNKIIRIVNPDAFSDDPLRMLRAVQFASRFGFEIEPKTMQMIIDNAGKIKEIAPERILIELDKIVTKGNSLIGVQLLSSTGLFKQIFGNEIKPSQIGRRDFSGVKTMAELLFLMMNGVVQNPAEFYLSRFSTEDAKRDKTYKELQALDLAFNSDLFNQQMSPVKARSIAHNMYKVAPQTLESQILPEQIENAAKELLQGKYPKTVNELAVNGNDLMQKGLQGKAVGDMQKSMLIQIYADKVRNDKEELLSLLTEKNKEMQEGYPNYVDLRPSTWDINGNQVGIDFFVREYDKWNKQGGYREASRESVLEFLQNNYEDESTDEKLKRELYWALIDRDLLNEDVKSDEQIEYGVLMLFLDVPVWKKITSIIKKEDIYEKNGEFGIETEPHVTILYGFHDNVNADEVFELYKENFDLTPIEIGVKGISMFENQDFDVVKMDVDSDILTKMNTVMRELPNTTIYPKYHAHITLAYVKKGCGKNYVRKFEKNRMLVGNELVFSRKKEKKKKMKLNEKGILKEELKKVSYSAVVLDDKSRTKLIKVFQPMIPEGWEIIAHHMTIKIGGLENGSKEKQDMENDIEISLKVLDYAIDDKVMAVGVEGYSTTNAKPHVTIAVNRAEGGKPFMSNKLNDWRPIDFLLKLTGKVSEE